MKIKCPACKNGQLIKADKKGKYECSECHTAFVMSAKFSIVFACIETFIMVNTATFIYRYYISPHWTTHSKAIDLIILCIIMASIFLMLDSILPNKFKYKKIDIDKNDNNSDRI